MGIVTNRDTRFESDPSKPIRELMTSKNLVTVPVGTTLDQAIEQFKIHKIEKLLVVDDDFKLRGTHHHQGHHEEDRVPQRLQGRSSAGCASAPPWAIAADTDARLEALVEAQADVICIDTAHGHQQAVLDAVVAIRERYPDVQLIAGNVATADGGTGPDRAGGGRHQGGHRSRLHLHHPRGHRLRHARRSPPWPSAARVAEEHGIPVIADGGIHYSGDVVKAIAAGANSVMIGSLFAGTTESPGERILWEGRSYKAYRAMGSVGAMSEGSGDRYFQEGPKKLVPEGIEGMVPHKGPIGDVVFQLVGGLRAGMGYTGQRDHRRAEGARALHQDLQAGLIESHPHDVQITKEAPNYERR